MKLIRKISTYYLANSIVLFITAFISVYFALNWVIIDETDEQLRSSQNEIKERFMNKSQISNPPIIEVLQVDEILSNNIVMSDTAIFNKEENEDIPYRQAVSYFSKENINYKLTIRNSLIEKEDLILSLLIIFGLILILMLLLLYLINRTTTKEIFNPFYNNLNKLKIYSIKSGNSINLEKSKIDEFSELNNVISVMSSKAGKEYKALKEFTEDLSHELQTPVAVVKSKLELLLQKDNNDEESFDHISKAYQNINKLDKLNRSLILLSKLESSELFDLLNIDVSRILDNIITNYEDVLSEKSLVLEKNIKSSVIINSGDSILEILIGNLVSNSIKHNFDGGKIKIELVDSVLKISNTGTKKALDVNRLFKRFNKNKLMDDSVGLGLAIVKKICLLFEYEITYVFENGMHTFEVKFENK